MSSYLSWKCRCWRDVASACYGPCVVVLGLKRGSGDGVASVVNALPCVTMSSLLPSYVPCVVVVGVKRESGGAFASVGMCSSRLQSLRKKTGYLVIAADAPPISRDFPVVDA